MTKRSNKCSRGKALTTILFSDLTSKSTCANLDIPRGIACHSCKHKLCVLTHMKVIKKTKSERQKLGDLDTSSYGIIIGQTFIMPLMYDYYLITHSESTLDYSLMSLLITIHIIIMIILMKLF